MAKEEKEIERTYTIPLRREWLKVPRHKRAKKASKAIKEFIAKHMKVEDRDEKKVKVGRWVNEALWIRGIKKPPYKIIVKATKDKEGTVSVEFVGLPPSFSVEEGKIKKKIGKAKIREELKVKARKKKKEKEEEEKKKAEEGKEEEKTEEEKKEEEERKEKEKILHTEKMKEKPEQFKTRPKGGPKEKKELFRKALEK